MATDRGLLHPGQRPISLVARVRQLERELAPRPSWMMEESRKGWRAWLAGDPEAPALVEELKPWLEQAGSIGKLLGNPEGRQVLGEVSLRMLLFRPQQPSQIREEQSP